jgi:transposase
LTPRYAGEVGHVESTARHHRRRAGGTQQKRGRPRRDVSRNWVQQLIKRYETEGAAAFEPHSRRPRHNPRAVDTALEEHLVRLRKTLAKAGYDAGAATIAAHLARDPNIAKVPAVATIWRILGRRGFVTPQPQKRPRSSWKRFEAQQPNELWQADVTHWHLATTPR